MALPTQPNGSSIVPLAGAPKTDGSHVNLSTQTEVTLVQNVGNNDSETVVLIQS